LYCNLSHRELFGQNDASGGILEFCLFNL